MSRTSTNNITGREERVKIRQQHIHQFADRSANDPCLIFIIVLIYLISDWKLLTVSQAREIIRRTEIETLSR